MIKTTLVILIVFFLGFSPFSIASLSESAEFTVASQMSVLRDKDSSDYSKQTAISFLSKNPNQEVMELFTDIIIKDTDLSVRMKAFYALLDNAPKDPVMIPCLHQAAYAVSDSNHVQLRELACHALLTNLDEAGVNELLKILDKESKLSPDKRGRQGDTRLGYKGPGTVMIACTQGLAYRGARYVNVIDSFYNEHREGEIAYCLAHSLFRLGRPPESTTMIEGIDKTTCLSLRYELIRDIEEIGDRRAIPVLEKFIDDQTSYQDKEGVTRYPIREVAQRTLKSMQEGETDTLR